MAEMVDGRRLAESLNRSTAERVDVLRRNGVEPTLAVILVGSDQANEVYVRRKIAQSRATGIQSIGHRLAPGTDQRALDDLIDALNCDPAVHGTLVQLPLPAQIGAASVLDRIDPAKDVDGFHPVNVGRYSSGTGGLVPCTPLGIMTLLDTVIDDYRGLNVVVIGKSNIVGKPVALLLLEREATVTVTHIATRNLPDIARAADVIVAAAGAPHLVRGYWVKPGAVVVDAGINRISGDEGRTKIVGDCASEELGHARALTPVPGGVGPITVACLLANTITAAERQGGQSSLHFATHGGYNDRPQADHLAGVLQQ